MRPGRLIVLVFLFIILLGAGLLCLPAASRSGEPTPFLTSLFTATSATCVTGLIRVDTGPCSVRSSFSCSFRSAVSAL